jgi:hypothetical protein
MPDPAKKTDLPAGAVAATFLAILLLLAVLPSCDRPDNKAYNPWPEQTSEHKPWTRMWWMGSAVSKPDMSELLREYAGTGFGGVEITPIYGARGFEESYIGFLSDEWMEMLVFTIDEAAKQGMGVDINLGTGWPYGGPQIKPEDAAKRLIITRYPESGGFYTQTEGMVMNLTENPDDTLLAVFAISEDGIRMDISGNTDKSAQSDGDLKRAGGRYFPP